MTLEDDFLVFTSPHPDPAGNGKKHWAGAQRPKAESDEKNVENDRKPKPEQTTPVNCVCAIHDPQDDATPHQKPKDCAYTNPGGKNLNLKLRKQAKKIGLIPGSPRWRAYVLGTGSAIKKRKRKDGEPKLTGGVTPVNLPTYGKNSSDNRTDRG